MTASSQRPINEPQPASAVQGLDKGTVPFQPRAADVDFGKKVSENRPPPRAQRVEIDLRELKQLLVNIQRFIPEEDDGPGGYVPQPRHSTALPDNDVGDLKRLIVNLQRFIPEEESAIVQARQIDQVRANASAVRSRQRMDETDREEWRKLLVNIQRFVPEEEAPVVTGGRASPQAMIGRSGSSQSRQIGLIISPRSIILILFGFAGIIAVLSSMIVVVILQPGILNSITSVPHRLTSGDASISIDLPKAVDTIAGRAVRLPLLVLPRNVRLGALVLAIRGLPPATVLTGATQVGPDSWLIDANQDLDLEVTVPQPSHSPIALDVDLRSLAGSELAQARTALNVAAATQISSGLSQGELAALSTEKAAAGDALFDGGKYPEALSAYTEALEAGERQAGSSPDNPTLQQALFVLQDKIGKARRADGDLADALGSFEAARATIEKLAASEPKNLEWQHGLSLAQERIGEVLLSQGNLTEAAKAFKTSLETRQSLVVADPEDARWQEAVAISQERIGDVLLKQGDFPSASNAFNACLTIRSDLAKADQQNAALQRGIAICLGRLAMLSALQGDSKRALDGFEKGRQIIQTLIVATPENATLPKDRDWFEEEIAKLKN